MGVFPVKFASLGIIQDIVLYPKHFIGISDNPFMIITLP